MSLLWLFLLVSFLILTSSQDVAQSRVKRQGRGRGRNKNRGPPGHQKNWENDRGAGGGEWGEDDGSQEEPWVPPGLRKKMNRPEPGDWRGDQGGQGGNRDDTFSGSFQDQGGPRPSRDPNRPIYPDQGGQGGNRDTTFSDRFQDQGGPRPSRDPNRPIFPGCGVKMGTRIIGGRRARAGEWQWMVALLRRSGDPFCGGCLISKYYVLTAAHCVQGLGEIDIRVRLGEYDFRDTLDSQPFDVEVSEIKRHPDYNPANFLNDIALLRLSRPGLLSDTIRPICLPTPLPEREIANKIAIVTGWGHTEFGGRASDTLKELQVPIWPSSECNKTYASYAIGQGTMCAGNKEGGEDSCQGDSGGPLMMEGPSGLWEVVGIVSWGMKCAQPGLPGIYTRVAHYLPWIRQNVDG